MKKVKLKIPLPISDFEKKDTLRLKKANRIIPNIIPVKYRITSDNNMLVLKNMIEHIHKRKIEKNIINILLRKKPKK
jgi:hypothetical protein